MLYLTSILSLLTASAFSAAVPGLPTTASSPSTATTTPLPLLIWHGLGDDFSRDGLKAAAALAESVNPGTYVHLISLSSTPSGDRQATFLGNLTTQIADVCDQLSSDPILRTAPAVNALGFSQGGQFLRAYVERCNFPRVHNLVTFGSPHNGIAEFYDCAPTDWLCRSGEALLRFGLWSEFVQSRLVPAQYFRDPEELDDYLLHSNFLADINNERDVKNVTYWENMAGLNRFAMFMFEDDQTVNPKESSWFAEVNATSGRVTMLNERPLYTEDWIGLRSLDERGKLDFLTVPGSHMQLTDSLLEETYRKFFGPVDVELLGHPRVDDDDTGFSFVKQG